MTQARRVNVRGIIYKDGKIFAQKLKDNRKGGEFNFWSTPGGGLDEEEGSLAGLHREMIEETGVVPKIGRLLFIQQFYDGKKERFEFFFQIENADNYEVIDLGSTTHGNIEVARCGFIDPKKEILLPAFLSQLDIESYATSVQPVYIVNNLYQNR